MSMSIDAYFVSVPVFDGICQAWTTGQIQRTKRDKWANLEALDAIWDELESRLYVDKVFKESEITIFKESNGSNWVSFGARSNRVFSLRFVEILCANMADIDPGSEFGVIVDFDLDDFRKTKEPPSYIVRGRQVYIRSPWIDSKDDIETKEFRMTLLCSLDECRDLWLQFK
jgi:hypothetical protein